MKIYVIYPYAQNVCRLDVSKAEADKFCQDSADNEMIDYFYGIYETDTHSWVEDEVKFMPHKRTVEEN